MIQEWLVSTDVAIAFIDSKLAYHSTSLAMKVAAAASSSLSDDAFSADDLTTLKGKFDAALATRSTGN